MNILMHELKSHLKSLLIWSGCMAFLIYAGMIKYGAFEKTGQAVNDFFAQIPPEMLKVLGVDQAGDLSTVAVFYSMFFLYFLLLAAVHSLMLGILIIAKEERDKTADFLFTKPVTRRTVLTWKMVAALINILMLNGVTYLFSIIGTTPHTDGYPLYREIFNICLGLLILQILFLGIGLLLGGAVHRSKMATGIGSAVILGTFLLKVLIDLNENIESMSFLTPFRYFSAQELMFDGYLNLGYALLALVLTVLAGAGSYYLFGRRDLHN